MMIDVPVSFFEENFGTESPNRSDETFAQERSSGLDCLAEMADINDKVENLRQRVGGMDAELGTISRSQQGIKSELQWHGKVGWGIAAAYAVVFSGVLLWLLQAYIPDKINDKIPNNFNERFGKLEANVENMQERLYHLTPTSLNDLISPTNANASEAVVTKKLRQASGVIDIALKAQIPAAPGSLAPLMMRVNEIRSRFRGNSQVRAAADSTEVRLSGYESASKQMLSGVDPTEQAPKSWNSIPSVGLTMSGGPTFSCTNPTIRLFSFDEPLPSAVAHKNIVVNNVHINRCTQKLDGPSWISDDFKGSTIEYYGGPLNLADVTFENCSFRFGSDANSKAAIAAITASKGRPVSILIP
jgi:hypothetical protein